jgi:DNA-binding MarR family transcriptional regulator
MNVKLERLYVALLELAAHRLKLHQSLLDASVPISEDAFMILLLLHSESPRGVLVKKITHVLSSISPVSYSLKRLSEKGLITMEKGVVDKRCTFVKLTSAGVALIDEVGQDF